MTRSAPALVALANALVGYPQPHAEDLQRVAEALREQVGIFLPVADRMRYEQAKARGAVG